MARVASIEQYLAWRKERDKKVTKLCRNYIRDSPNLDGSILEIFEKMHALLDRDNDFLHEQRTDHQADMDAVLDGIDEMSKDMEKQMKERLAKSESKDT